MLRKTLTILSLIGLLLSVGLWALSYGEFFLGYGSLQLELYDGALAIICLSEKDAGWWILGPMTEYNIGSTFWLPEIDTTGYLNRVPLWIPTLGFAATSVLLYRPLHRRRKCRKLGLCIECGYNLRGLTEPRCPECNTPFEKCSAKP